MANARLATAKAITHAEREVLETLKTIAMISDRSKFEERYSILKKKLLDQSERLAMSFVQRAKLCEKDKDYSGASDSYAQALKALEGSEREVSDLVERIAKSRGIAMCKLMEQRSKASGVKTLSRDALSADVFDTMSPQATVAPVSKGLAITMKTPNSKRPFFKASNGSIYQPSSDSASKFVIKKNNFMLHPRSTASNRRGFSPRSSVSSTNEFADQDLRERAVMPTALFAGDGQNGSFSKRPSSSRPVGFLRQATPPKDRKVFKVRGTRGRFATHSIDDSRDSQDAELEDALIREPAK